MKRIILALIVTVVAFSGSMAQKKTLRDAEKALRKEEYSEAMQLISEAEQHEETGSDSKTYFVKGQIYAGVAENAPDLEEDALEKSIKAYQKVVEMTDEKDKYNGLAALQLNQLYTNHLNAGATAYQSGDLETAYNEFEVASMADPMDTTAVLYAGVAAQQLENYENALKHYYTLIDDLDYTGQDVYSSVILFELDVNEDPEKALEVLGRARELYPENQDFMTQEINILIEQERADEARAKLQEAIKNNPDNATMYYNLGYLNDEMGKEDEAMAAYKNAIEIRPDYYEANFNVAVAYYNKAADLLKEANNLDLKEYQKKGPKMEQEAKGYMEKSLPYLEKAHELKPEEVIIIETLQAVYTRLGMNDKAMEMKEKAEAMYDGE
ncbi:tetratricopeptide repeat protein [Roseivirga sp. BDSF3-8]|uniref:tetratricopeptide repeat protein n=1 Tax=Roseivirga sp. BDSF3-8 TaxID=3241598 RepID=UPI003531D359